MDLKNVGEIIATRRLYVVPDKTREILVAIGKPQKFPESDDYYCPYQITGIGRDAVRYAGGVDAVQAIQLAMKMIGADLEAFNATQHGAVRWTEDGDRDLGFPI